LCTVTVPLTSSLALVIGCTSLHWAAGSNQIEVIRYLVEERSVAVNITATNKARGRTPLHYAARNGRLQAAKLLVELGAFKLDTKHQILCTMSSDFHDSF